MEKRKIVFFSGTMGRGGAERVISILSNYLVKNGWDVTIILLLHNITGGYKLDENIKLISFVSDDCKSLKKQIWMDIKAIRKYLDNEKPELVMSFMGSNTLISGLACIGKKVRYIASERIDPAMANRNFAFRTVIREVYTRAEKVIFQTKRAKAYFNKKIQNNGVIIGNPISVTCKASNERKNKIVTVGRLEKQKNHKILIDAFCEVCKKYPQYCLEIYGNGTLREYLEEYIKEKDVQNNVTLMGEKSNVHECIKDAKIFVLSSDYEGLSNALLEAMMMGIACISTNCAGSDEVIENEKNGILVNTGDSCGLANAIINLIENEEQRKSIEKNAMMSVDKYKTENIISKWMEIIEA